MTGLQTTGISYTSEAEPWVAQDWYLREKDGTANLARLTEPHEKALMTTIGRYSEVIELAANNRAPQHLVNYLRELANEFHTYYNAHTFIVDESATRNARLALITAVRSVIASGLAIIGVSAPESM
jgi:arginyl-tRNA synthetase